MAILRPDHLDDAYPPPLRAVESEALKNRRRQNGLPEATPAVGFALSGGGIRSATFCLGLFQALARRKMVRRIDYLSTVSGGGYFGSFLGAAFMRPKADADSVETELSDNRSWPVDWLRENGRFLSPNGAGDNWQTVAVALRNWASLQIVILTFAFFTLGLATLVRSDLASARLTRDAWGEIERFFWDHPAFGLWGSPWLLLPVIPLVFLLVPTAVFYWTTQWTPVMATARAIFGLVSPATRARSTPEFTSVLQYALTRGFMLGLVSAVALLAFALVDSLGQTAYLRWAGQDFAFPAVWAGLTGTGLGLYAFGAKIAVALETLLGAKKFRVPFDVLALGLAGLWLLLILLGLSVLACGFAWHWTLVWKGEEFPMMESGWPLMVSVAIAFALSWIFSRCFGFVNLSSMQQLYAARLSRAYLGASNPRRREHANYSMTALIPGDEMALHDYAPHTRGGPLHFINVTVNETVSGKTKIANRDRKGLAMAVGPTGLSVGTGYHALWGPATKGGANSPWQALWETCRRPVIPIAPPPAPTAAASPPDKLPQIEALSLGRWVAISGAAFTTGAGANTRLGLSLLLGLANVRLGYWWDSGLTPVRPAHRENPRFLDLFGRLVARVLPVQACLLGEFFARFHGPARRHWYLSDGGHFENTACYELIRRRVPMIFCSDAGQDPNYQFEDLANLVRKARTDFGAEIEIVHRAADLKKDDPGTAYPMPTLEQVVHPGLLDVIGSSEDFPALTGGESDDDDSTRRLPSARRHALLARIHYLDTHTFGWLLMIKPSLMGDESIDVVQYQRTHPLFPQEPTSDQHFDEAQWESYRKLGEHIGTEIFTPPVTQDTRWSPSDFAPPAAPTGTAALAAARELLLEGTALRRTLVD